MWNKFIDWLLSFSLRRKLVLVLLFFTIVPSAFLYNRVMMYYKDDMMSAASQSAHSIVVTNNKLIDTVFSRIEDASYMMLNSKTCYDIFSQLNNFTVSDYLKCERLIASEMVKQFIVMDEVYEYFLYTPEWIFNGSSKMNTNLVNTKASGFEQIAKDANGLACWITGYDYGKVFDSQYLISKKNYDYQFPFTLVRQMKFKYSYNSVFYSLNDSKECPVLFLHVLESSVRKMYEGSVDYEGSKYVLANEEGIIISSDNRDFSVGESLPKDISALSAESGYIKYEDKGKEYMLCYDGMEKRNWFSFVLIPMDTLIKRTEQQIRKDQISFTILLLTIASMAAILLSATISRPIAVLKKAALRVSEGDFSASTPVPKGKDFRMLTENFNHMETEITRLIRENYEISLREKDTQIMALSMQINPHFLYNTLNTINMLAIQNEDEETSDLIVSLSEMIHYTFRNTEEKILLTDEIRWTQFYIQIMEKRFEGVFTTEISVPTELLDYRVPRFFLQPLAENAIIHGFKGRTEGGLLRITVEMKNNMLHFRMSDNGVGMNENKVQEYMIKPGGGIGVSNVHKRLTLLYGDRYSVEVLSKLGQGTEFHLVIPVEKET